MSQKKHKNKSSRCGKKRRLDNGSGVLVGLTLVAAFMPGPDATALAAPSLSCVQSLQFGSVSVCASAGTVTISPTSGRSVTGCLQDAGPAAAATCVVTGQLFPQKAMNVSVTAATDTINNGGTKVMDVKSFKLANSGSSITGNPITVTAFITTLNVGAVLHVGANQTPGYYSGTSTINVDYQ